jgi:CHASE3 domain sensor protein
MSAQQQPSHVVSLGELRAALVKSSAERAANIQEVQKLLRHDEVQKRFVALADLGKIDEALPTLDDATLRQLAADSRQVNDQLQAGIKWWGWVLIVIVVWIVIGAILVAVMSDDITDAIGNLQ